MLATCVLFIIHSVILSILLIFLLTIVTVVFISVFVVVDIRKSKENVLLYTSMNKRLIQGMFALDSVTCPTAGLATVPINPIKLPSYVNKDLDVHLGYDPVEDMIYFSDGTVIRKASAGGDGYKDRVKDTGMLAKWDIRDRTFVWVLYQCINLP